MTTRSSLAVVLLGGVIFGFGLALSGVAEPEVVLSFLQLKDLGLLFVLGVAVLITTIAYQLGPRMIRKPILGGKFGSYPETGKRDAIFGSVLFGLGWGLSGLCPGTALAAAGMGNYPVVAGIVAMFLGAYAFGVLQSLKKS